MATISISTAEDWINLTKNGVQNGATYNIANNIDLTQYVVSSINMASTDNVTINGQGKTITISQVASDFTGLFASFNGSINLLNVVYNSKLNITHTVDDVINFGFLIGQCWGGYIGGVTVTVNDDVVVNISTYDQKINFGGFVGYFDNTVNNPNVNFDRNSFIFEGNVEVACKISNPNQDTPGVDPNLDVGCNVGGFIGCMNLIFQNERNSFNNNTIYGYYNLSMNAITNDSPINIGGFCGYVFDGTETNANLNGCSLTCNNLSLNGNCTNDVYYVNIGAGFGHILNPNTNDCTFTIRNNLSINSNSNNSSCGGLIGYAEQVFGTINTTSLSVGNTTSITGNSVGGIAGWRNADYSLTNVNILYGSNTILSGITNIGTFIGNMNTNVDNPQLITNNNVLFDTISFTEGNANKQATTLKTFGDVIDNTTGNYTNVFATSGNNAIVPSGFKNNLTNIETVLNGNAGTKFLVPIVKAKYSTAALTDDFVKTLFESSPNVPTNHKLSLLDTVLIHSDTASANVPFAYLKNGLKNFDASVSDSAVIKHLNPANKLHVAVDGKFYIAQNEGDLYLNKLTRIPFEVDAKKGGAYFNHKFVKVGDDVKAKGFNFKLLGTGSLAVEVSEPSNLGWWFWVLIGFLALFTLVLVYYLFIKPKPMYIVVKDFKDL